MVQYEPLVWDLNPEGIDNNDILDITFKFCRYNWVMVAK
jgi:hypothetical protein